MRHPALALCTMLAAVSATAAPAPWLEVKSAHFTVVTDAGEKSGRKTAWQFEQIRAALVKIWPWAKIDTGRPFVVVAARDETTLKTFGPQYWEGKQFRPVGFSASGRDKHFIAVRTDVQEPDEVGQNPYQSAYWSYVSSVFTHSFPRRLPEWYARGVAEVMSNTIVRDKELHIGRPLPQNLRLARERLVPLAELLSADRSSHWLTQETDISIFDANAWALVHYILFGEERAFATKGDRFNQLLLAGTDPRVAMEEAFGDMKPYYDGMRRYVERSLFTYVRALVAVDTRPEVYAVRPLSPAEAAVVRGEMLVATDRPVEARAAAGEAAKSDPASPGPSEIEAELLDRENRRAEAKAAYAKAAETGSKRAHVYYRLAQLEWVPQADQAANERQAATLEKARALDPGSADTLSFLADVRVNLGQGEEALALAKKAVEIEPAESYHRLTLARALWHLRRPDEAVQAAQSALQAADDDSERKQAQEFLDFAARARRAPTPPPAGQASSETPAADMPETLDRACRAGDKRACAQYAVMQAQGQGVPRDRARALSTLKGLCDEGFDDGCVGWAIVLVSGSRTDVVKAKQLLQAICDRGSEEACALSKSMPR
jgi:tetratricopeptide (TPR) repeat protein